MICSPVSAGQILRCVQDDKGALRKFFPGFAEEEDLDSLTPLTGQDRDAQTGRVVFFRCNHRAAVPGEKEAVLRGRDEREAEAALRDEIRVLDGARVVEVGTTLAA